jgi:hypothetical protein
MANKDGHRRFGSVRKLPSGRYQIRYIGTDGQEHTGPETFARKSDADRTLVLYRGADIGRKLDQPRTRKSEARRLRRDADHPAARPSAAHRRPVPVAPEKHIGTVAVGKMSAATVREWRAKLLANGVSVSMAAKAYRLLRAIMTTAVDDDGLLPRNPCRLKGAGDEHAAERPVLTVGQV